MKEMQSQSVWPNASLALVIGVIGGVGGTLAGLIPGFIALRASPGGYGFFVDLFLLIETFSAIATTVALSALYFAIKKTDREAQARSVTFSVLVPIVGWFALSALAGLNSYRIGGWLVGTLLGFGVWMVYCLSLERANRRETGLSENQEKNI